MNKGTEGGYKWPLFCLHGSKSAGRKLSSIIEMCQKFEKIKMFKISVLAIKNSYCMLLVVIGRKTNTYRECTAFHDVEY